jgi:UDP-2-acetamido-2-deoxy-ribo-hexuluronate aminotransferase
MRVEMLDLHNQYKKIEDKINSAALRVLDECKYINGPSVLEFANKLSNYLNGTNVITCANGTDALQIAMMALDLKEGDEVIVPAFTYIATAEVISLLKLKPVLVDVHFDDFTISIDAIRSVITSKTKVIVPVHLFGQCANMEEIINIAKAYNLHIIEDCAQALGSVYTFSNGVRKYAGTIGHIGCTSFFPSKNLGCFGDGGAIFTDDPKLAEKIRMISNHGQKVKYEHEIVGVNSRLDTIQAAILSIKLDYLDIYNQSRQKVADFYFENLKTLDWLILPSKNSFSTHVFHQFTIILNKVVDRSDFKNYLNANGIDSMIYYPIPLHFQKAYALKEYKKDSFKISEQLCNSVLSLPIHTELSEEQLSYVVDKIKSYI